MLKNRILSIVILFSFMQLFSCRGTTVDSSSETTTTEETEDDAPKAVDNVNGFYVEVETTSKYDYVLHKGTGAITDDFSSSCKISSTDSTKDITCVVEAKEFDLYFNGATLRVNVPQNLCEYFTIQRPHYYNFIPGVGPTVVIDNRVGLTPHTIGGITANPGEIKVGPATKDSIYCDFDYSTEANPNYRDGAKNCCSGKYTVYNIMEDDSIPPPSEYSWGGEIW